MIERYSLELFNYVSMKIPAADRQSRQAAK
jgi:hypothetical protein